MTSLESKNQSSKEILNRDSTPEIKEPQKIHLWSEKLNIDRCRRKVGEVIVRKETETQMIQIPVRREKLIVECIGENPQQLAEVVIKEDKINGFTLEDIGKDRTLHLTKSNFLDIETARQLLEAIANLSNASDAKVRLEIVSNCSERQIEYQAACDRHCETKK